jgi:hypothetical protein
VYGVVDTVALALPVEPDGNVADEVDAACRTVYGPYAAKCRQPHGESGGAARDDQAEGSLNSREAGTAIR